jgi:hypothetical protein
MLPNPYRVKVLRSFWNPTPPASVSSWPCPPGFWRAVFQGPYLYSLRSYWLRNSFGVINLEFDVDPALLNLEGLDGATLRDDTDGCINAVRDFARGEGLQVDGYNGTVVLVNPPPSASRGGAGRVLFDQKGRLEHYQHETGHMLGLEHAFGPDGIDSDTEPVYEDPYCVMGDFSRYQNVQPPPEGTSLVTPLDQDFWRSSRRVSVATLYRYHPDSFGRWVAKHALNEPGTVGAASAVAELGSNTARPLAVYQLAGNDGEIAVEYRVPTGDDVALGQPAVVVHSIGFRKNIGVSTEGIPYANYRPIWYEGTIPPVGGRQLICGNYLVTVEGTDFPGFGLGPLPPVVRVRVKRLY